MLALLIASSAAANSPQVRTAVDLCRPVLARKAGGEIATIVTAFTVGRKEIAVRGRVTIFAGMGPPAAGYAIAHHLVRSEFNYRCTIERAKVRSASLKPVQ